MPGREKASPWGETAQHLARLVATRRVSAREVCDWTLQRIADFDPAFRAFATPTPEIARATADRVDAALARGEEPGPLAGVPFSVKDLIFTRGVRTTLGSPLYRDLVPDEDDIVVERMKAAGAVMLGKTNTSELGFAASGSNPIFPPTRNPWNAGRTPGGSSAGAAVAVATGMGPLALGSDGGGSIRIPASFCGVVGFKPSMGRVPLYPGSRDERFPGLSSFESVEHIGPIARTVADAALMFDVIAGPDPRDRHSRPREIASWRATLSGPLAPLRIAYSPDWGFAAVEPQVRAIVGEAVAVFETELGCSVEETSPGFRDPGPWLPALEALDTDLPGLRRRVETCADRVSSAVTAMLEQHWTAEQFCDALTSRKALCNLMARFMARFDLLVTPTLAVLPFSAGIDDPVEIAGRAVRPGDWAPFPMIANLTGQPALSVPAGWTDDGLPVGLHIVGRHLDDATVLRAAAAFEAARPWAHRWPPLVQAGATLAAGSR